MFLFPYPKYYTINWNLWSLTFLVPVAYVLAVDCQTNEFCQDVHNSHMGCAHGSVACINNKCTCYIPNNHNIGKCMVLYQNDGSVLTMTIFDNLYTMYVNAACTAKDVCLSAPITQLNCTADLRHCVDGKCVCTSDIVSIQKCIQSCHPPTYPPHILLKQEYSWILPINFVTVEFWIFLMNTNYLIYFSKFSLVWRRCMPSITCWWRCLLKKQIKSSEHIALFSVIFVQFY